MDDELRRIEEEIRKSKEKRQELENRRIRRLRKIREKQERDRAAWLKKMTAVLDKTLCDMEGKTYFDTETSNFTLIEMRLISRFTHPPMLRVASDTLKIRCFQHI